MNPKQLGAFLAKLFSILSCESALSQPPEETKAIWQP
jgi:hypothetical protein